MSACVGLTDQFNRDGFFILDNVLSEDECDALSQALQQTSEKRLRAGLRNLMSNKNVSTVANDPRLLGIVKEILGPSAIPYKATLFAKTGKANWLVAWHQDTALPVERAITTGDWGPSSVKEGITFSHAPTKALSAIVALRLHLDPSRTSNGPLRVIPGSHRVRLSDVSLEEWTKKPSVECLTGKGGVVVMSPLLLHASSKCVTDEPRRILHTEYAESLDIDVGVRLTVA